MGLVLCDNLEEWGQGEAQERGDIHTYTYMYIYIFFTKYSLEGLMLKLKLQYFGHLMGRTDSLEKTLMLGKIEGGRRRG